jgi:hypothetical protein
LRAPFAALLPQPGQARLQFEAGRVPDPNYRAALAPKAIDGRDTDLESLSEACAIEQGRPRLCALQVSQRIG